MLLLSHLEPFEDECANFSKGRKQHRHTITNVTVARATLTFNHRVFFWIAPTIFLGACFGHVPLSFETESITFYAISQLGITHVRSLDSGWRSLIRSLEIERPCDMTKNIIVDTLTQARRPSMRESLSCQLEG